jgi:hypothetical protein
MWNKDRQLLEAYRECYKNLFTSIEEGEEVELAGACQAETEALANYTVESINYYKDNTPQQLNYKYHGMFMP